MSFWRTLSRKLGFSSSEEDDTEELDDEDYEEDEYDEPDEDEEDEEEEESAGIRGSISSLFGRDNRRNRSGNQSSGQTYEEPVTPSKPSGPIIKDRNIIIDPRLGGKVDTQPHCERIIHARQIDDCRNIIKYLIDGESVLLNLENVEPKDCGRIVDLLSGAAYALSGRMIKVAHLSYLLAPVNVEVIEDNGYNVNQSRYR